MNAARKTALWLILTSLAAVPGLAGVSVTNLRCEYRENPLGIDARRPRLGWQLVSPERGQRQTAYRVLVASSPGLLQRGEADLWDSGRVASAQSSQVHYAGGPLNARQQVFWKVQIWDQDGRAAEWSPVANWDTGLLEPKDWSGAAWIRLAQDQRSSPLSTRPFQTSDLKEPIAKRPPASPWLSTY